MTKINTKNTGCSCISSQLVSESLLVVLIASLLNKSISMLNVLGERKEREKLLSSVCLVAALKRTSSSILTFCSF